MNPIKPSPSPNFRTNSSSTSNMKWPYLKWFDEVTFIYGKKISYFIAALFIIDILLLILVYNELNAYRLY